MTSVFRALRNLLLSFLLVPCSLIAQSGGSPFQLPVPEDDVNWMEGFGSTAGSSGLDDEVFALASDGPYLYVGGAFSKAGDENLSNVAQWDGRRWLPLGTGPGILQGTNGPVNAIAADGDIIYIGGQFTSAGSMPTQNIARWSRSSRGWARLGGFGGITGTGATFVSAILVDGDNVYVGGLFERAGGVTASNVAVWNKTTGQWSALGTGVDGNVNTIAKGPDGIYVGGSFSTAGDAQSSGIARWDGTSWHGVSGGVNGFVNRIDVLGDLVFVAGGFDKAGDTVVRNVARWDVEQGVWTRLTGFHQLLEDITRVEENGVDDAARAIAIDGKNVYFGGTFTSAFPGDLTLNPVPTSHVARWHEDTVLGWQVNIWWAPLGRGISNGTDGFVNAMVMHNGSLYVAGSFSQAGGIPADRIARWDGQRWFSLSTGAESRIAALAVDGDNGGGESQVFVGGVFRNPGGPAVPQLAELFGTSWDPEGNAVQGSIYTLALTDEYVYAGGRFTAIGDVAASNIARWNRTTREWSALGAKEGAVAAGDISWVTAIAIDGDNIWIGGQFDSAGGMAAQNVAVWNSATDTWQALGAGTDGPIFDIATRAGNVYVSGRFLTVGADVKSPNVARWSGTEWHALDGGANGPVYALKIGGDNLYAGGMFDTIGGDPAANIAMMNLSQLTWSPLGSGLRSEFLPFVNDLAFERNTLYAVGHFDFAGDVEAMNIARWDGGSWSSLGTGVNNNADQIAVADGRVYVAGSFSAAGGKPSQYFGIYTDPVLDVRSEERTRSGSAVFTALSPNPFRGTLSVAFRTNVANDVELSVIDPAGREVSRILDGRLPGGEHRFVVEGKELASGVYFVRLRVGDEVVVTKVVKL